jgi:hypothetical protein
MTAIQASPVEEAERLLTAAQSTGATMALLGGVAVRLRASEVPEQLDREYQDLDFAVPKRGGKAAAELLSAQGYEPDTAFNALHGKERLIFHDPAHGRHVDVFVGSFRMCHEISFDGRLDGTHTVPLAELVLTKLQIVQLNEKDVRDTVLLFLGHEVSEDDGEGINGTRIAELCAEDWGLWRTITGNLEQVRDLAGGYGLSASDASLVKTRLEALLARIEAEPKSRGWKLRAKIGERKRWYELPDEVDR